MTKVRMIEKPTFNVIGQKTWISGQDNELFGQFWVQCREAGLFEMFSKISGDQPGAQTGSSVLGVSCVEKDPSNRGFYYLVGVEKPETLSDETLDGSELDTYHVPASLWAVFACVGKVPEAIVKSEIYAFTEWLPSSGYEHAKSPEMEVYFPGNDGISEDSYCEFWLPVQ